MHTENNAPTQITRHGFRNHRNRYGRKPPSGNSITRLPPICPSQYPVRAPENSSRHSHSGTSIQRRVSEVRSISVSQRTAAT